MTHKELLQKYIADLRALEAKATRGAWEFEDRPHRNQEQCSAAVVLENSEIGSAYDLFDTLNRGYKVSGIEQQMDEDSGGEWYDHRGAADLEFVAALRNSILPILDSWEKSREQCNICRGKGERIKWISGPQIDRTIIIPCPACAARDKEDCERLGLK